MSLTSQTATDAETIEAVVSMGGRVQTRDVAKRLGLNHTATLNRLNSCVGKGLLRREPQPGRRGYVWHDPRFPTPEENAARIIVDLLEALPPREFVDGARRIAGTVDKTALLRELERLRAKRSGQAEDRVLEVMDFVAGWSAPHMQLPPSTSTSAPLVTVGAHHRCIACGVEHGNCCGLCSQWRPL